MCGIAGIFNFESFEPVSQQDIGQMLGAIRHRGPDEFGIYLDRSVGLGSARLSIIDLSGGQQPIANEDRTLWIVFNGEIFNYLELRPELEALGHRFATSSDTEVLLHMFEEFGPACLQRLNGQFAFAIWNTRDQSLFLARDRLGVRPLFYSCGSGRLVFASEMKAIFASRLVSPELDPVALDQIFTFWCPLSPNTPFQHIKELPPGHYLCVKEGALVCKSYWEISFPDSETRFASEPNRSTEACEDEFRELLVDAARIRLRADVPVGAYLSGGLDSSIIAAIVRKFNSNQLDTFSIAFDDAGFDESRWQRQMAKFLGTRHQVVQASYQDIGKVFPEVVWHAEMPLLRTAPAPMFLLAKLVRACGYKVVLTGEGADEFLAGYDIFKEAKVRRFWAREPDSSLRPLLLKRLYPDIAGLSDNSASLLAAFFRQNLTDLDAPDYSHAIRWRNNRRTARFFSEEVRERVQADALEAVRETLPRQFTSWHPLARAQYLEIHIFLSHYLLSSQGDRMGMAHSIEGRFPFLDCRLVEFCTRLPANLKLRGLTEKYLLKRIGKKWLPEDVWRRPKRPYRAPIHRSFFTPRSPEYVRELLSPEKIRQAGQFRPAAVTQLVRKIDAGATLSETDDMALAGILSTQLLHYQFVESFSAPRPVTERDPVKVCLGQAASQSRLN